MITVKVTVHHAHGEVEIEEVVLHTVHDEQALCRSIDSATQRAATRAKSAIVAKETP